MFDGRFALLGELAPTREQINVFQQWARSARAQAAAGDSYGAQASYDAAVASFIAMGSPMTYKDELDYAAAAVYGGSGTDGAGSVGALSDVRSGADLLARGRVNARPESVSGGFFSSLSDSVDQALASLGSAGPFFKWAGLLAALGFAARSFR